MANVTLTNADNVDCLYAGNSLSLFMDLSRRSGVVALCSDSIIEDVPVVVSLTLQHLEDAAASLPSSSRDLLVCRTREDGVGGDIVSFAVEGGTLLRLTIDLAACAEQSRQIAAVGPTAAEPFLVDQAWRIGDAYSLLFQLRAVADAVWPVLPSPQWSDVPASQLPPTPRSHHHYRDVSSSVHYFGDDSMARPPSTVRSMTSRTTRLFNPSEPRSQLLGPIFVDQTLFPLIRILFVPELFTKSLSTPPNLVWNMSLQVTVEKNAAPRARRAGRERMTKREPRRHGEAVNVEVEENVVVSSGDWAEEDGRPPRQLEAIALGFNADYRDRKPGEDKEGVDSGDTCDVARASRLVVGDFTFTVLVSTKKQAEVQVEEILRTVYSYCNERDELGVLDLDLEDLMEYIYDRYAYMKMTPYLDGMTFHDTVWQAVRAYMVNSIVDGEGYDADVDDGAMLMDGVLANA